jgi:PAS domain-containing protein
VVFHDVKELVAQLAEVRRDAHTAAERADLLFRMLAVPCVLVEPEGTVADANAAAVRLLNCSQRHLVGRPFQLFVGRERDTFLKRLKDLPVDGGPVEWEVTIRPRERSAVTAIASAAPDPSGCLVLMLRPRAGGAAGESPAA